MSIGHHAGNLSAPTIVSAETMQRAILECGLVPFFENPIAGYSVEEMTHPSYWFDGDAGVLGPWDWKIDCVQSGDILYGKYLCGGKAAFATFEWYRELRNYRQSLVKYALQQGPQTAVMDYVNVHGSISVKDVRALLGIKKSAADALLTRLQMQCRLVIGDLVRVYTAAQTFTTPAGRWRPSVNPRTLPVPAASPGLPRDSRLQAPTTPWSAPTPLPSPSRSSPHTSQNLPGKLLLPLLQRF